MSFAKLISLFEEAGIMTFIGYFFLFNLVLITSEIIWDLITAKKRRWNDTLANISIFVMNQLLEKTILGSLGVIFLIPISMLSFYQIPLNIYTWIVAFFVADFTYYWMHRLEHEHRILWASHSVHHSSQDYNLTISMRLSIVEGLFEWMFLIPMVLVGFSPFQAIIGLVLVAQFQTWIHTKKIGKLGWLDEIFNTPSVHRVHHGSNNKYLDKNYGGFLIIWDKLFGTYQREEEKVVYGLTKNIETNNPITINFIEYKNIWKEVKRCKTLKDKLKIIFGNLIWKPEYFGKEEQEQ
ncbi:sterol desaturase family protein [Aquimarina spongiae]|uniref:Sterol desaturase/sphingolipid hydroxylase, fatty acid hydroxylase superfamily n=1 Tax=Aquimarina spongiae TaxID=570521 RepID=A0A1M6B4Z5_9FLAO|nr:sterol desaturase family protein [Aquimarina spongiae]SHI43648.1 Sterol desaturase/sphingolipid hydroxylase, fatty acid hydroxylase superfamily [Aquimarina spongiae]